MPENKPNEEPRPKPLAAPAEQHALPDSPPAERKSHPWIWVLVGLVIVLGIGLIVFLRVLAGRVKPTPPPAAVPITMAKAQKGDIPVYVNALGTVTPVYTVTIASRVDGQVLKVSDVEGKTVRKDDVLVELDPKPFQAQVKVAQGQLDRDQALLAETMVNRDRFQAAFDQNAIPKQQLQDQAALVLQLQGTVKLDQGQLDSAQTMLDYCTIKSPITGLIGLRRVDPGNIVHASDTGGLLVVAQVQPINVTFAVAEDYLPQIQEQLKKGRRLPVEAYDRAQQKKIATGELRVLDNLIDTSTGTLRLKAQFENQDGVLYPNQFVNARLLVDTLHDVTLVATSAIQASTRGAFVYVVKPDQTVAMRKVKVGITEGDVASVAGLDPGETIAADNFNRLQDGAQVVERKPANDAAGKPESAASAGTANEMPAKPKAGSGKNAK